MSVDSETIEKEKTKLKRPAKWIVIIHNDDVTPMNFVVELLHYVFNLDVNQATELMLKVHHEGQGIAGVYPFEVAEQKLGEAQALVNISNQQLKLTMQEET